MTDSGKAVFLSYASQDAEAARRICDALRGAGVEVWFDVEGGLEHGDEWDAKIRRQIKECVLFIAVVSQNTQAREEGYFRIEWDLAAERARGIASGVAFILPVAIDDTREAGALVPDRFRSVQWTRLPGGVMTPEVRARFLKLWSHRTGALKQAADGNSGSSIRTASPVESELPAPATGRSRWRWAGLLGVGAAAAVGLLLWQGTRNDKEPPGAIPPAVAAATTEVEKLLARVWALYEKQDDATGQDWTLAEDLAAEAVKREPANADAWAAYSQATLGAWVFGYDRTAARFTAARTRADRALGLAPESFEARFAVANCHRRQQATRLDGERALRGLVAERPTDKRVIRMLAQTLRDLERTDEAIEWLDRAAALPGGDPIAVWGKYAVYAAAGRVEEAEAVVAQSLAIRRGPSALLRQVAVRLLWHGDLEGAAGALRDVPGPFQLKAEGVYVSYLLGRWRRDPNACLAALQLAGGDLVEGSNYLPSPNSAVPTGLWRGDAYALAGNRDAAEKNWRDTLAVVERRAREQPDESAWTFWRASLQARLGERAEGLRSYRLYRQLAGSGHTSGRTQNFSQGIVVLTPLVLLGETDEALTGWEQLMATARTPRHRELLRHELRLDPLYDGIRDRPRFRALVESAPAPKGNPAGPAANGDAKSVAVLAFRQLSAEPENDYLGEAISDELCNVLGRVPGLRVAASASAFSFKGRRVRPAEMAAQLGVAYLVDGTVQKIGNRLRVRAQLIQAADEKPVWSSGTLEHEVKDMFAVQDEIVGAIANSLELQFGAGAAKAKATNPEAYRLYYEARRAWSLRGTAEAAELRRAEALYRQAIALDPAFGRAWAGLAEVTFELTGTEGIGQGTSRFRDRNSERVRQRLALANEAVRLEPDSAEAHTARARILWSAWQFEEAERELRAALRLNPNYADAYLTLGRHLHADGRMDEALAEVGRAAQLDPLTSRIFDNYSLLLGDTGRHAEALIQADRALALLPASKQGLRARMMALSGLGRHAEAVAIARRPEVRSHPVAAKVLWLADERDEAIQATRVWQGPAAAMAVTFAAMGRMEDALAVLDPDETSTLGLGYLFYRPELDPIRGHTRFVALLDRLGLQAAHRRAQAWRAAQLSGTPATK